MPLSSVLGANSLIKPGVTTSTARPSVPYEGQLIYETDTDRIAAYDGSKWVTQNGLQLVASSSFTTQTSVSLPNNTFSSLYTNYKLILNITAVSADADFTMRMRASGTDDSNTSYQYAFQGIRPSGTTATSVSSSATSWVVGEQDAAVIRYSLVFDVLQPQATAITSVIGSYTFTDKANTYTEVRTGAGWFTSTTSFDSLTFISSVASSITGSYRVYGYANN